MNKKILLAVVLTALVALCLVFASCDNGSSDSSDPVPPPAPEKYTVSFNANGGTGTMSDVSEEDGTYTIPENKFEAPVVTEGALKRTFKCWNTAADGTGTPYAAEGTIPATDITANITLYAQWTNPLFTVANDGSGNIKKVRFSKGNLYLDGSSFKIYEKQTDFEATWNASKVDKFYWSKTASVAYAE